MVITLDKNKRPLGFMSERRCRILLEKKRAVLYRYFPTIVKERKIGEQPNYCCNCGQRIDWMHKKG